MTPGELDRALESEDRLEPSSGFTESVMEAVRREAAEPPPLPFPWLRLAAGLAACCLMALAASVLVVRFPSTAIAAALAPLGAFAWEIGYAAVALACALSWVFLPRLIARE